MKAGKRRACVANSTSSEAKVSLSSYRPAHDVCTQVPSASAKDLEYKCGNQTSDNSDPASLLEKRTDCAPGLNTSAADPLLLRSKNHPNDSPGSPSSSDARSVKPPSYDTNQDPDQNPHDPAPSRRSKQRLARKLKRSKQTAGPDGKAASGLSLGHARDDVGPSFGGVRPNKRVKLS